jgi:3-methyladenine DNA glycosylase/8-oxoguanine DNA glycosylase
LSVFTYTQEELAALKKKDKKLAVAIERIGMIERGINKDIFSALIDSIVSQQISNKAAETVGNRLALLCGGITPERIHNIEIGDIQKCGMSMRKAGYIKNAGEAVHSGSLDLTAFAVMPDEEIIRQLSELPGIGIWTAEMMLIFSLERRDVLSFGDLAIRRGLCNLYGHKSLTKEQFARYKKRYSPYGSIASLYLWELSVEQGGW